MRRGGDKEMSHADILEMLCISSCRGIRRMNIKIELTLCKLKCSLQRSVLFLYSHGSFYAQKKVPSPQDIPAKTVLGVRCQGLEPWTT